MSRSLKPTRPSSSRLILACDARIASPRPLRADARLLAQPPQLGAQHDADDGGATVQGIGFRADWHDGAAPRGTADELARQLNVPARPRPSSVLVDQPTRSSNSPLRAPATNAAISALV